jgi:hypothetical protein
VEWEGEFEGGASLEKVRKSRRRQLVAVQGILGVKIYLPNLHNLSVKNNHFRWILSYFGDSESKRRVTLVRIQKLTSRRTLVAEDPSALGIQSLRRKGVFRYLILLVRPSLTYLYLTSQHAVQFSV